jgi:hypothetical protein
MKQCVQNNVMSYQEIYEREKKRNTERQRKKYGERRGRT